MKAGLYIATLYLCNAIIKRVKHCRDSETLSISASQKLEVHHSFQKYLNQFISLRYASATLTKPDFLDEIKSSSIVRIHNTQFGTFKDFLEKIFMLS